MGANNLPLTSIRQMVRVITCLIIKRVFDNFSSSLRSSSAFARLQCATKLFLNTVLEMQKLRRDSLAWQGQPMNRSPFFPLSGFGNSLSGQLSGLAKQIIVRQINSLSPYRHRVVTELFYELCIGSNNIVTNTTWNLWPQFETKQWFTS